MLNFFFIPYINIMFVIKNINNASSLTPIGEITVANLASGETTLDRVTVLTSINDITTSQ